MKIILFIPFYIFLLTTCFQRAEAQSIGDQLVFDQFSRKQGLVDDHVNFVFQDSRKFIWLGTNHGISRFDGRKFKNYSAPGDLIVHCVAEDSHGNIWFGTEGALNKFDPLTEHITQYAQGTGPGTIPYPWCDYLFVDKEKQLWLTTEKGLALYNEKENSFHNYPVSLIDKDDRINKFISKVVEDDSGRLWMATSYGIKRFDKKTNNFVSFALKNKDAKNAYYSVFIDHNNVLWAGSYNDGLVSFDRKQNALVKKVLKRTDALKGPITDISEIKLQDKWYLLLTTFFGLVSIQEQTDEVSNSISAFYLSQILKNNQQELWIASASGLLKLNPNSFAFKWLHIESLPDKTSEIFHLIPDIRNPGKNYFFNTLNGWYQLDADEQKVKRFPLPGNGGQLLRTINRWVTDSSGYWFTSRGGFGYYDLLKNKVLDYGPLVTAASGQATTVCIVNTKKNEYWVSMRRSGILVFNSVTKKDTVIFGDKDRADNIYGLGAADMQLSKDGKVWFTSRDKLYRVDPNDLSYKTFSIPPSEEKGVEKKISPMQILFSRSGRIIICSPLRIYEFINDRLQTIYPSKGLSPYTISKITEDGENNIWIQADEGVFRTNMDFRHWETMEQLPDWGDGSTIAEINTSRPGQVLFVSNNKIGILNKELLQKPAAPLPILISRFRYGQTEKYMISQQTGSIESSYKDAIEIDLSPVNYENENESRIFYHLQGWDKDWNELVTGSTIRYEQLPPGDYTFVARAVNDSGMEGPETAIGFTVVPPFYRSWWFICITVIALAMFGYLISRYRLKKALELESMRNRIATDLHDDIGATLSSISIYSQVVKDKLKDKDHNLERVLDKMGENSREMVNNMNDIVWAINPSNDQGEKLIKRIESYAIDLCSAKNIQVQFHADERLNNISLPLEHRKNIYLVFKEAINNAVKYSAANKVEIALHLKDKTINLQIKDNGKGFDKTQVKKGNGLKNFESRAREINGTVDISAIPGAGTTISFMCTI